MLKSLLIKLRIHSSLLILLLSVSVCALSFSFIAEYGFNFIPCKLCNLQRILYGILAFAALIGIFTSFKAAKTLCALILLSICIVASYQTLVQYGIVQDKCRTERNQMETIASFEAAIADDSVPCSQNWAIFKIPISGFNAFVSLLLFIVTCAVPGRINPAIIQGIALKMRFVRSKIV